MRNQVRMLQPFNTGVQEVTEGEGLAAVLRGATAGSAISGLTCICLDEAGRPATTGLAGKLRCSWAKRHSKKATLSDQPTPLPDLVVGTTPPKPDQHRMQ